MTKWFCCNSTIQKMKKILTLLLISIYSKAFGQESINTIIEYPLIIQDSPAQLFTMDQFNTNYLSLYRLLSHELDQNTNRIASSIIKTGLVAFFFTPLTHEEGHRSILTKENIGSVSQPFFNKHGAAYVKGVNDLTLQNLRNNSLPTYIRLHTAGLESDYVLSLQEEALLAFEQEDYKNLYIEAIFRKFSLFSYYTFSLIPQIQPELQEEKNELERDIVGHDVYGAIRHLHRPDMDFYRYTNHNHLTKQENQFLTRVSIRSLINLVSLPFLKPLKLSPTFKSTTITLGYTMVPFGDLTEVNLWINNSSNMHIYLRGYQNKDNWFPALGLKIYNLKLSDYLELETGCHGWLQPEKLSFITSKGKPGGALNVMAKYKFSNQSRFSLNAGIHAKTYGFLPGNMYLEDNIGLMLGLSYYRYN